MTTQWSTILPSAALPRGAVREQRFDHCDLLVYRTPGGVLGAIEAWCPHMANYLPSGLAQGAQLAQLLHGEQIVCPFHQWHFDNAGRCTGIPPGQRVPARIRANEPLMRSWDIRERRGLIELGPRREGARQDAARTPINGD